MKMLHVDTLAIAKKMESAGLTRDQAGAIAESISSVDSSNLTTKDDLRSTKDELRREMAELRADLTKQIYIAQAATIGILFTLLKLFP